MQYAIFNMLYSICNMQYAICNMQCAICYMLYAICNMQYAICNMQYSICNMQYAICYMISKQNKWACPPAVYCCVLLLCMYVTFFTSTSTANCSAICQGRMLIFSPKQPVLLLNFMWYNFFDPPMGQVVKKCFLAKALFVIYKGKNDGAHRF